MTSEDYKLKAAKKAEAIVAKCKAETLALEIASAIHVAWLEGREG